MGDININLDAATKQFLASIAQASKTTQELVEELQKVVAAHKREQAASTEAARQAKADADAKKRAAREVAEAAEKSADAQKKAAKEVNEQFKREYKELEKAEKELQRSRLDNSNNMKRLFEAEQASRKAALDEALRTGRNFYAIEQQLAKQTADYKAAQEKAFADKKKAELAEIERQGKLFYQHEQQLAQQTRNFQRSQSRNEGDFGKSMLAEAARMKSLFEADQRRQAQETRRIARETAEAERQAIRDTQAAHRAYQRTQQETARNAISVKDTVVRSWLAIYAAVQVASGVIRGAVGAFQHVIDTIDKFQRGTIGTAIAITNLADETLKFGRSWETTFQQNLTETREIFVELERVAARYFATATDLQLAYNTFAQRGVVLRKDELDLLAQLTDTILLLTQGQQSTIQVQEEIRSLLTGSARATAQLSQLVKAFGLDIDEVAAQIRATQSLKPLEPLLKGARAAQKEVSNTFQAVLNSVQTAFTQLERVAGQGFFESIKKSMRDVIDFINKNSEKLGAAFAAIGNLVGKGVTGALKFLDRLISGPKEAKEALQPLLSIFAAMAVAFNNIAGAAQAFIIILAKLPKIITDVVSAFNSVNEEAGKTNDNLSVMGKEVKGTSDPFTKIILGLFPGLTSAVVGLGAAFGFLADQAKKAFSVLPEGKLKAVAESLGKTGDELKEELKGIIPQGSFADQMREQLAGMNQAVGEFLKNFRDLKKETKEGFVGTRIPLIESDESKKERKQIAAEIKSASIQLARMKASVIRTRQEAQNDLDLQALRRDLALLEQGFVVLRNGAIDGIRSIDEVFSIFIKHAADEIAHGIIPDPSAMITGVETVVRRTTESVFNNLDQQLLKTTENIQLFIDKAKEAAQEQKDAEVLPVRNQAEELRNKAEEAFKATVKANEDIVKQIQDDMARAGRALVGGQAQIKAEMQESVQKMNEAKTAAALYEEQLKEIEKAARGSGQPLAEYLKGTNYKELIQQLNDARTKVETFSQETKQLGELQAAKGAAGIQAIISNLESKLNTARDRQFSAVGNAQIELDREREKALGLEAKATFIEAKIDQRALLEIEQERRKEVEQRLRALQQIQQLVGNSFQRGVQAQGQVADIKSQTAALSPRTELENIMQPGIEALNNFRRSMAEWSGEIQGLQGRLAVLQAQQAAGQQAATDALVAGQGEEFLAISQMNIARQQEIDILNQAIPKLIEKKNITEAEGLAALNALNSMLALQQSMNALRTATTNAMNGLLTAITDSFEGKKTDFKRLFKGVFDNMFKDAMKTFVDSASKAVQDGFNSLAKAIAPGMESTLGPAMMAGFALIASFLISQLMGDQGGEGTAANPTVGIQSTEQVRGLIGGETQIPIGQIAESLQDALVPTNMWLSRIYGAISASGGLSTAQVESIIERSVNEALQIQPA